LSRDNILDDYHIVTQEDYLPEHLAPISTISHHSQLLSPAPNSVQATRLRPQTLLATPQLQPPQDSESAYTRSSFPRTVGSEASGPSELGDIVYKFPSAPTHIPEISDIRKGNPFLLCMWVCI